MGRSIAAVVYGMVFVGTVWFAATRALRSIMPAAFTPDGRVASATVLLIIVGYVFVFAVAGCYLTARLAPNRPMRHAMALGAIGLVFNGVGTVARWHMAPPWYHALSLALVLPAAWLGGKLRAIQVRGPTKPAPQRPLLGRGGPRRAR